MPAERCASFTVPAAAAGQPLAALVTAHIDAAAVPDALAHGGVWVAGRRATDQHQPLAAGAEVTVHFPPAGRYAAPQIAPDDICYEDAWLLVLNKRAGWYTTPTPWDAYGNVRVALSRWLAARDGRPPTLHLTHQLDRDTSGLLLCTRVPALNGPLQAAFNANTIKKHYLAVCQGQPAWSGLTLCTGHGRGRSGLWRLYPDAQVGQPLPNGKPVRLATTTFRVLRRLAGAALVRATLHTGRTHQVRLHLAALGHPLLGDTRYGGPAAWAGHALPGHLLHAAHMRLTHPATEQPLDLYAPLPPQFAAITGPLEDTALAEAEEEPPDDLAR